MPLTQHIGQTQHGDNQHANDNGIDDQRPKVHSPLPQCGLVSAASQNIMNQMEGISNCLIGEISLQQVFGGCTPPGHIQLASQYGRYGYRYS
jgi:hypothetical protein